MEKNLIMKVKVNEFIEMGGMLRPNMMVYDTNSNELGFYKGTTFYGGIQVEGRKIIYGQQFTKVEVKLKLEKHLRKPAPIKRSIW